jgi:hypothetical protein
MARFISIKVVGGADAFEDGQHLLNTDSVITVTSGDEAGANEGTKTTIHTSSPVLNTVVLTHSAKLLHLLEMLLTQLLQLTRVV